jgi:hypothetical protein
MSDLPTQDFQPRFLRPKMSLRCESDAVHRAHCKFLLDGGLVVSHPRPTITGDIVIINRELVVRREGAYGNAAIEFIARTSGTIAQELAILSPHGRRAAIVWEVEISCINSGQQS